MNARRVLVTGGAGFIGVNLARLLGDQGFVVRCFDDFSTGHRADAEQAGYAEVVEGDVLDGPALADAASGCEYVVHLAAQAGVPSSVADPLHDCDLNVRGTLHALVAARDAGARGFVFASSNAPLGDVEPPAHEGLLPRPKSPYGASKLAGEAYCSAFAECYGLPTVALRFSNVYGPFSYHKGSVIAEFCRRATAGEPLLIYGDGGQTRDFVYVGDLCAGISAAMTSGLAGRVVHLGTGVETTIAEVAKAVIARQQAGSPGIEYRPPRTGDIVRNYSDIGLARRLLGYRPTTALEEGLATTMDWFAGKPVA